MESFMSTGRFKNLIGSKRKSSHPNIVSQGPNNPQSSPLSTAPIHTPTGSTSSTTSLPMSQPGPNGLGRPPSYTYNPNAPRANSPLPPVNGHGGVTHHPPPIHTTGSYSQGHPALGGGVPQPPQYAGGYTQPGGQGHAPPPPNIARYGPGREIAEIEGNGRSKAQLIVGIDFVSTLLRAIPFQVLTFGQSRVRPFLELLSHSQQIPKQRRTS